MRTLFPAAKSANGFHATFSKFLCLLPFAALLPASDVSAQDPVLDPRQVFSSGYTCPADAVDAPNNFSCSSNDITLTLVELSGLTTCTEGEIASAAFDIDIEVNANIRYNPIVWISQNGIDPRETGSVCFASSVPDGPDTHIPYLDFFDANQCADIDVPSNNFTLSNLGLGTVDFLCTDSDADGLADIPIVVTWANSEGASCGQDDYPINQTPSKCDAFTATTDIIVASEPGLVLTKAGTLNDDDGTPGVSPGDSITYTFTVENTGDVELTNVTLTDPKLTSVSGGPIATLGIGATDTTTFTGTYIITQADIDRGFFTNTATAAADEGVSDDSTFNQPLAQSFLIELDKTGTLNDDDGTPGVSAGDTISYEFTVTNTGNTTLTNITISDPDATVTGGPLASLAPQASDSVTFTGEYAITQADIDSGSFTNTATVVSDEEATDQDDDTQPLAQNAQYTLDKTASPQTYAAVDAIVNYSFEFTNSGNITLYPPYTIDDDTTTNESCPDTPASLAPGESVTCSATYTIVQADIDAGLVTNVASGTARTAPNGGGQEVQSNEDDATVGSVAVRIGVLQLVKVASPVTYDSVGDVISYSYELINNTNFTLSQPYTIEDDKSIDEDCSGAAASMAPGESVFCSATYTITQDDLDATFVTNVAEGTAQDPFGDTVQSTQDEETVDAIVTGDLVLVKAATPETYDSVGDVISYSYELTNSTNQTLFPPYTIEDDKSTDESCPDIPASLAPGESVVCDATYEITQDDLDAGSVTNLATGAARDPADAPVLSNEDSETVDAVRTGSLGLVKTATPQTYDTVGDVISYEYELTNNFNVTIYAPYTVSDDKSTDEFCPDTPASLAPGESVTCSATYTITQADLDNRSVVNVASGTASDGEDGTYTSNQDTETVTTRLTGSLTLDKTAAPPTYDAVGQVIDYSYELTNGLNVTVYAPYTIDDDKSDDEFCPDIPASLAPGESVVCTATYTITQDDLDNGSVVNVASGTASDGEDGTFTSNQDTETVNTRLTGSLALDKVASPETYDSVGQVIDYSYELTNSLNVTVYAPYTIDDDKSDDEFCPDTPASLAPGESVTCSATYTITQDDLDNRSVVNVATGTASDGDNGTYTSNQDTETVNALVTGALGLVKTATPQTYHSVDQVIDYSYELTNGLNVTVYAPYTIDDDTSDDEFCPDTPASLAPGESVTCSATYTITQDDLDNGSVVNVAYGTASDGEDGTFRSNEDTETVTAEVTGSLTLDKTASPTTYTSVDDVIYYTYELTNGTNITLFEPYRIDDDKSTDAVCPATPASLAPGESVTCSATYTILEADLEAGSVTNVAIGTAEDSDGETVTSNEDSETVNAVLISMAKTADAPSYDATSGRYTVVYTITVTNAGTAGGTYYVADTFAPATGITLYSATIAYGGGETQTGDTAGPLPYTFANGETVVTNEGLGAGATETWIVTGVFEVDPTLVTEDARACVDGQEQRGQGFYNYVSGADDEPDMTDNDACANLPDPTIDLVKTAGESEFSDGMFTVIYTVTANNLGDGPGFYDLVDSLQPGNGISVAMARLMSYNAGTEDSQSGDLAGPLPYTFTSPATLVTGEALAGGRSESWTIEVEFDVAFSDTDETFICSQVDGGAGTGLYNEVSGSDTDPDESNNYACTDPTGGDALFRVTKDFTDDNTMEVRVHLACNNGLPTEQALNIGEFGLFTSVTFVMTKFSPGDMDCTVTELPVPDGYSESYEAPEDVPGIADSIDADELGCHFENVFGGLFECHITNTPDPVDVSVDKVWEVFEQEGNAYSMETDITLFCEGEMPQGAEIGNTGVWFYSEHIIGNDTVATTVIPRFPSSRCWATESISESFIDIDNQCGDSSDTAKMSVSAGSGDQCTIINTVFFEGIPTLNRYGLMLLALLMLGVGIIGFRRFA